MMKKLIAISLATLMLAAAIPAADAARTHGGRYVPGTGLTIWCSADQHNLAPIGDPDDYSSPLGWLFSGEPECAPNDAQNLARGALGDSSEEGGIGGFAWIIFDGEQGTLAVANTNDDVFGVGQSYFTLLSNADPESGEEDAVSEGCGPQAITIPLNPENHWQSTEDNPLFLMWAFIDPVGVTDDLTPCFSSAGSISATIG